MVCHDMDLNLSLGQAANSRRSMQPVTHAELQAALQEFNN